ncbi:response regulator transcription factor [Saccharopolyspora gregorii]|uniref:response regulator transcription factor n=1 Tax=Saccharopolyspora gregorii TaxID=33914 RepID=UPI0021ABCEB0|nr:response regulator transcription factor [Saccharopolyspora gregorii]
MTTAAPLPQHPAASPPTSTAEKRLVLVMQDEPTVTEVVGDYLRAAGYLVVVADGGTAGLELVRRLRPDLVVLDTSLPGIVVHRFREEVREIPGSLLLPLAGGAEDDPPRRFSPRELVSRVRQALPDEAAPATDVLAVGDLVLDRDARVVRKAGRDLELAEPEFDLLAFLMRHPGRTWRRDELARGVGEHDGTAAVLCTVRRLRELIEDDPSRPRRLVTVWGAGYRLEPGAG